MEVLDVLINCEYSGIVREEFKKLGHNAWSCDLLPSEIGGGNHIQGDAIEAAYGRHWDLMIGHPPCTYMCNSGVEWLDKKDGRWPQLMDAADFFLKLWSAPIEKICLENPIMHKYAYALIKMKQTQVIQPYMFGHTETKATCLWLKNLPKLTPTNNVKMQMMQLSKKERERLHYLPPSPDRGKIRSKTYEGIAKAMAQLWGMDEGKKFQPVNIFD